MVYCVARLPVANFVPRGYKQVQPSAALALVCALGRPQCAIFIDCTPLVTACHCWKERASIVWYDSLEKASIISISCLVQTRFTSLEPRPSLPRFYLAAVEKNRGVRPGSISHVMRAAYGVRATSAQLIAS